MKDLIKYVNESEFCTPATLRDLQLEMLKLLKIVDKVCRANNIEYWLDFGTLLGAVRHKGFIPWDDDIDLCVASDDYHKLLDLLDVEAKTNKDIFLFYYKSKYQFWFEYLGTTTMIMNNTWRAHPCKIDIFPMKFIHPDNKENDKKNTDIARYFIYCKYIETIEKKYIKNTLNGWLKAQKEFLNYYNNIYMPSCNYKEKDGLIIDSTGNFYNRQRYYTYDNIYPLQEVEFEGCRFFAPNNIDTVLSNNYGDYMTLPPEKDRKPHHSGTFHFCKNKMFAMQIAREFMANYSERFFVSRIWIVVFTKRIVVFTKKIVMKLRGKMKIRTRFKIIVTKIINKTN